jgi:hypothetical protein
MENIEQRLRPLEYLNQQLSSPAFDRPTLMATEQRYQKLHHRYNGIIPTIGCEIEVKHSSLQPELFKQYFGDMQPSGKFTRRYIDLPTDQKAAFSRAWDRFEQQELPRYQATQVAGIPKGNDAFWEFANSPTYAHETLATEVDLLFQTNLVPKGIEHALHITLGGIHNRQGGMALVLSGLELSFASPERIMQATYGNHYGSKTAWSRRGQDGLRERQGNLDLGARQATEMRSLTVQSGDQATQLFQASQMLGFTLQAYRSPDILPATVARRMRHLWQSYRQLVHDQWRSLQLPASSWGEPQQNNLPWHKWAEALRQREEPDSKVAETVRDIGQIILQSQLIVEQLQSLK